ncbi:hypothetical protein EYF80_013086 [Liparis tanakae]|uniref:Uncharacterized protein n=1 Tax=Liparis tanakae TaxID=230148 RepID=A0A4Z2IGR1_9TELE|nr:hypothetical protein EYF80_013086 [Liparis tanakae]
MMDFIPEAQTLLMLIHAQASVKENSLHLNIPAWSMAPLMAMEPSLVAGTAARLPLKEPIGVRAALTITTS